MTHHPSSLSNSELQQLFISESDQFMQGIDDSICFDDLKDIRVNLRTIAAELQTRKLSYPTHNRKLAELTANN